MKPILPAAALIFLGACATSTDGRILNYVRSNSDGTQAENISVYQRSADSVEVYKHVVRCARAALVTARFDPEAGEALELVGGAVSRGGTQEPFAWLSHEPSEGKLTVRLGAPDAEPVQSIGIDPASPWRLYDFDFADFNAVARPPVRGEALTWSMALVWPDDASPPPLRNLGLLRAEWQSEEMRAGHKAYRYALSGAGFDGGQLWLGVRDGVVLEVASPLPNHPGYTDFRLVLTGRASGEATWTKMLTDHWSDCGNG